MIVYEIGLPLDQQTPRPDGGNSPALSFHYWRDNATLLLATYVAAQVACYYSRQEACAAIGLIWGLIGLHQAHSAYRLEKTEGSRLHQWLEWHKANQPKLVDQLTYHLGS